MQRIRSRRRELHETPRARLVARKFAEVGVVYPAGSVFALQKLNPGHWQKSAGAWAFELWVKLPNETEFRPSGYGSPDRASDLRVSSKLSFGVHGSVYFAE